jgi:hypothetical protein
VLLFERGVPRILRTSQFAVVDEMVDKPLTLTPDRHGEADTGEVTTDGGDPATTEVLVNKHTLWSKESMEVAYAGGAGDSPVSTTKGKKKATAASSVPKAKKDKGKGPALPLGGTQTVGDTPMPASEPEERDLAAEELAAAQRLREKELAEQEYKKELREREAELEEERKRDDADKAAARENYWEWASADPNKVPTVHGARPPEGSTLRSGRTLRAAAARILDEGLEEVQTEHEIFDFLETLYDKGNPKTREMGAPQSHKEAVARVQSLGERWDVAMQSELASFVAKHSTTDVQRAVVPRDKKVLGGRWVFSYKPDGALKARYVVQGFRQRKNIDFFETSSPVVDLSVVRLIVAWSLINERALVTADVRTAFLNGEIDCEIYAKCPPGYESDLDGDVVWKLNSSVYGLKQSPRLWWITMRNHLVSKGYKANVGEPCLFRKKTDDNKDVVCLLFVDDFTVSAKDQASEDMFFEDIERFAHKRLGRLNEFLGIQYDYDPINKRVFMSQQRYIDSVIDRFVPQPDEGGARRRTVRVPIKENTKLTDDDKSSLPREDNMKSISWLLAVAGAVRWLERLTRPDLAYALHEISKFVTNPGPRVIQVAQELLLYIQHTREYGLVFDVSDLKMDTGFPLGGYCDSSYAEEEKRKSLGAWLATVGNNVIVSKTKVTSLTVSSTGEAEIVAAVELWRTLQWLCIVLTDLDVTVVKPIVLQEDNTTAIAWSQSEMIKTRTKHFQIRLYVLRDAYDAGEAVLRHCPTNEMVADIGTKALGRVKFEYFRAKMGVVSHATFTSGPEQCKKAMHWM